MQTNGEAGTTGRVGEGLALLDAGDGAAEGIGTHEATIAVIRSSRIL
jgi:hypothetical protein